MKGGKTDGTINRVLETLPLTDVTYSGRKFRPEAEELLKRLKHYANEKAPILFGHQDTTAYGVKWQHDDLLKCNGSSQSWPGSQCQTSHFRNSQFKEHVKSDIYYASGKLPAVYGWDLGGIDTVDGVTVANGKKNIDGVPFSLIRRLIIEADARGGINTLSFHQNQPLTDKNVFCSRECKHDVDSDVAPETVRGFRKLFAGRLKQVADFLLSLRRANGDLIPVILRPFHEHTEEWAWWGPGSISEVNYRRLFRSTVSYLQDGRGLTNVLFAYSPQDVSSEEDYLYGYPGDDVVDVFGLDQYVVYSQGDMNRLADSLAMITRLAEKHGKIAALTEIGVENVAIHNWWCEFLLPALDRDSDTRKIVWVLTWRNACKDHFFIPHDEHPELDDFRKFANNGLIGFEKPVREPSGGQRKKESERPDDGCTLA